MVALEGNYLFDQNKIIMVGALVLSLLYTVRDPQWAKSFYMVLSDDDIQWSELFLLRV